jgi:hypothetical protein
MASAPAEEPPLNAHLAVPHTQAAGTKGPSENQSRGKPEKVARRGGAARTIQPEDRGRQTQSAHGEQGQNKPSTHDRYVARTYTVQRTGQKGSFRVIGSGLPQMAAAAASTSGATAGSLHGVQVHAPAAAERVSNAWGRFILTSNKSLYEVTLPPMAEALRVPNSPPPVFAACFDAARAAPHKEATRSAPAAASASAASAAAAPSRAVVYSQSKSGAAGAAPYRLHKRASCPARRVPYPLHGDIPELLFTRAQYAAGSAGNPERRREVPKGATKAEREALKLQGELRSLAPESPEELAKCVRLPLLACCLASSAPPPHLTSGL